MAEPLFSSEYQDNDPFSLGDDDSLHFLFSQNFIPVESIPANQEEFLAWKSEADQGFAEAEFLIGMCYENGSYTSQCYEKALYYYKLAADQDYPLAFIFLGTLYEEGRGTQQSYDYAIHYYKLASMKNEDIYAVQFGNLHLGKLFAEGKGVPKSPEKALDYFRLAADEGNSLACLYLAEAYQKGLGTKKSQEKTIFYCQKGYQLIKEEADAGDAKAQADLGWFLENGIGIEKSLENAFAYYQLSAYQNFPRGIFHLAECFAKGKGTQASVEKASHYYKLAADQGYPLSQVILGQSLLKDRREAKLGVHYLLLAVEGKQCDQKLLSLCQGDLGNCYEKGIGVEKSEQRALYYYRLAADSGDIISQERLGNAYLKGELGVEKSIPQAIHYHELAGNQGWSYSLDLLGECYEKGKDVEPSPKKAFEYYKRAAEIDIKKGKGASLLSLAHCYKEGIGIEKSIETAIYYYKLAGDNGLRSGYYEAGRCYIALGGEENKKNADVYFKMGDLGQKNTSQKVSPIIEKKEDCLPNVENENQSCVINQLFLAKPKVSLETSKLFKERDETPKSKFEKYQLGAESGIADFQYHLALCYMKGDGVEKSQTNAFKYFKLAADQGDMDAQLYVGIYYEEGRHDRKSIAEAYKYYKLAADQGNRQAQYLVGECCRIGGKDFKEAWKTALVYYKLAADQGDIRAIKFLYECYHYGKKVEESEEQALKYLILGAQLNDPECLYNLSHYYAHGKGGLTPSAAKRMEYCRLAAKQGYQAAELELKKIDRILNPHAQEINIQSYVQDHLLSTLAEILKAYGNNPIFLELPHFSWEEVLIIRDAMIENHHFTFMCKESELPHLYEIFELLGYDHKKNLKCCKVINPSTQQETCGCVFVGNNK